MKVLQINNHESNKGGSDHVYHQTTNLLIEKGHDVATLSCDENKFSYNSKSKILRSNQYHSKNPLRTLKNTRDFIYRRETERAVESIVSNFRPDVAHLHIFYGHISSSVLVALRRMKIPTVMTVHEYRMLCPISTLYRSYEGICEKCACGEKINVIINKCNKNSYLSSTLSYIETSFRDKFVNYRDFIDHFFMVSNFCLNKHTEYIPEIEKKSSVLYNFIQPNDLKAGHDVEKKQPFLYVGRISFEKGLHLLCTAFKLRPEFRLRIAGDGPLLNSLIDEFGEAKNIEFIGKIHSDQVKKEMQGARFTVLASEWYENNPIAVLESFAAGVPVIAADIGGIPELVYSGKTGYTFTPSSVSSLVEALDQANSTSDQQRNYMGERARALVRQRHNKDNHYDLLISGYTEAIKTHAVRNKQ
jgi:glycosyltransferase involved in cell wall biosynthesis